MNTQNKRIMEDQLVELTKDRFFVVPTGELVKCNDDGDLMVAMFNKKEAIFKDADEAEKTKKRLTYNLKYLGYADEDEDGNEIYFYSDGSEEDAVEEIIEIEDEFAEAYALIMQYKENGFNPNALQFKKWTGMMKDLSKQDSDKLAEQLDKMQAFLSKNRADNSAVIAENEEEVVETVEEPEEEETLPEFDDELRNRFKKGFKIINLLRDAGKKPNQFSYKAWSATFENLEDTPYEKVEEQLGKMRKFAEDHRELLVKLNNEKAVEADKPVKEKQVKDQKKTPAPPKPSKPLFPATIKYEDEESGETLKLSLATGKYNKFDEVREALNAGKKLMFVNHVTPQDIIDFDLVSLQGINDIEKFPGDLEITEVLYLCESIDKVHTVCTLTEAVYYYFYDTLKEKKVGNDLARFNGDMMFQIYEVK